MKKILLIIASLFITSPLSKPNFSINARNYIVMDAYSHEVLEGKDIHSSYSVASISKIMTAIIAIESNKLFNVVTVDENINKTEGSSLYLALGDKITLIDLVYGLLLRSGNDAANMIASTVSKNIDSFVTLMNEYAFNIGMKNTRFHNPSGLDIYDEGNISSCYDMALLMSYCMNNELFRQISSCKSYKSKLKGVWLNKNKLLRQYKYCIGGKTGYTYKAKRTLINCAEKDDQRLIVVTFSCGNDFETHKNLFEKYFNNYYYLVYFYKGPNYISSYVFYAENLIGLRLNKDRPLRGIKKYYVNNKNDIYISFLYNSGEEIKGNLYNNVKVFA